MSSFVTGIEFRDGNYVIGPKSSAVFREGMSININLGFQVGGFFLKNKCEAIHFVNFC